MCWPAAELAVAERLFDALHEREPWHDGTFSTWSGEFSEATPWHYRDGTRIYLAETDENPSDQFLADKLARPEGLDELGNGDG